jgi:hypothetical protein
VKDGQGKKVSSSSSSSRGDSDSENKEHVSAEEGSNMSKGYKESFSGGLCPTTTWEIAVQHAAAATAYVNMVRADEAAAKERGEDPGKTVPFRFTWPGKPVEDAYAPWVVTDLPVGGERAPLPPHYPSAALGGRGRPTALHVYLVLELLLLCWPNPHILYSTDMSLGNGEVQAERHLAGSRWDWLLLMTALLQQTSTDQKQQIMLERGPLLMQLLYQALLEDQGLGIAQPQPNFSALLTTSGEMAWESWFQVVTLNGLEEGSREATQRRSLIWEHISWVANIPLLVTLVLQNLLLESLPESWVNPKTARICRVLSSPIGKCGTCAGYRGNDGF